MTHPGVMYVEGGQHAPLWRHHLEDCVSLKTQVVSSCSTELALSAGNASLIATTSPLKTWKRRKTNVFQKILFNYFRGLTFTILHQWQNKQSCLIFLIFPEGWKLTKLITFFEMMDSITNSLNDPSTLMAEYKWLCRKFWAQPASV